MVFELLICIIPEFRRCVGAHSSEPARNQCIPTLPKVQLVLLLQSEEAELQEESLHHQIIARRSVHLQPKHNRVSHDKSQCLQEVLEGLHRAPCLLPLAPQ